VPAPRLCTRRRRPEGSVELPGHHQSIELSWQAVRLLSTAQCSYLSQIQMARSPSIGFRTNTPLHAASLLGHRGVSTRLTSPGSPTGQWRPMHWQVRCSSMCAAGSLCPPSPHQRRRPSVLLLPDNVVWTDVPPLHRPGSPRHCARNESEQHEEPSCPSSANASQELAVCSAAWARDADQVLAVAVVLRAAVAVHSARCLRVCRAHAQHEPLSQQHPRWEHHRLAVRSIFFFTTHRHSAQVRLRVHGRNDTMRFLRKCTTTNYSW
jgi:hypothetical protein